jgi:hypothetical protein
VDKAYSFDGINDYIVINNTVGNFGISNFTISVWFTTLDQNASHLINKRYNESCGNFWEFRKNGFGIEQNTNCAGSSYFNSAPTPVIGNWYNVLLLRNGNSIDYYINGVLNQSLLTSIIHNINNTNDVRIGAVLNPISGLLQKHNGKIDDIAIWNRALSQQEITDLYNGNICYQTITVTDTLLINTGITGFNPITYENTLRVWPNPTNDHITIDAGNLNVMNGYSIRITNSLGQQMFQSAINQQQFYLDLSTWTGNGMYFLNLIDPSGNIIDIKKIVLQ